ncbi:unnamed protein product [Clavelina lepadiformis]|uniref:Uncharacterized protein n=2 Tax=Clavelina lepadiformis TaxID=159417 RepID=A0ABP0GPT2_CLALP
MLKLKLDLNSLRTLGPYPWCFNKQLQFNITSYNMSIFTEGGTDASSPENFRRCIQCNGATDINCKDKTTGSVCTDSANQYCSVSRTTTLSPDGQMLMESITRSCTPKYFAFDECFISREDYRNIPGSNFQYTCVRTCDTDNCNTGLPGKAIPNPSPTNRLQCMVCNANTCSSPSTYRDARTCPGKSTHCFSSVTYVITDKSYLPVNSTSPGNYYLQNVERKCVNSAVNAGCTTVSIGYGLSRVTCVETCQGNLCNIGWPARPRCSSCKARPGSSSDLCKNNPPLPRKCQYPYHEYCIMEETSYVFDKETSDQRQMSSISRGCSHLPLRNECVKTVQDGFTLMNCTKSCTSNSCNLGPLTFTGSSASLTQPFVKLYFWCVFINAIALTMSLEKCLS